MEKGNIRIHKIIDDTCAEGPGRRLVFWVQGCSLHCQGCFEQDTWNHAGGHLISVDSIVAKVLSNPELEGITVLGGEPFEQAGSLALLLEKIRGFQKNSIVFSGYDYENLKTTNNPDIKRALAFADLLIDGRFDKNARETKRPMVGSQNQNFIALSKEGEKLIERLRVYKNRVEIRITKDGTIKVNGMWKKEGDSQ